jgi:hypothetical protein
MIIFFLQLIYIVFSEISNSLKVLPREEKDKEKGKNEGKKYGEEKRKGNLRRKEKERTKLRP